jgi:hypothetical protein
MRHEEMYTKSGSENLKERDHMKDTDVDGKIILKWIFKEKVAECGLVSFGLEQGPMMGCYEHDNEPSGSIQVEEFLD